MAGSPTSSLITGAFARAPKSNDPAEGILCVPCGYGGITGVEGLADLGDANDIQ